MLFLLIAGVCLGADEHTFVLDPHGILKAIGTNGANILMIGDSVTLGFEEPALRMFSPRGDIAFKGVGYLGTNSTDFGMLEINNNAACTGCSLSDALPTLNQLYSPFTGNSFTVTGGLDSPWFKGHRRIELLNGQAIPELATYFPSASDAMYWFTALNGATRKPEENEWNIEGSGDDVTLNNAANAGTLKFRLFMTTSTAINDLRLYVKSPGVNIDLTGPRSNTENNITSTQLTDAGIVGGVGYLDFVVPALDGGFNSASTYSITLGLQAARNGAGEVIQVYGGQFWVDDGEPGITITNGGNTGWWSDTFQDSQYDRNRCRPYHYNIRYERCY
jgi:hypothetical protein